MGYMGLHRVYGFYRDYIVTEATCRRQKEAGPHAGWQSHKIAKSHNEVPCRSGALLALQKALLTLNPNPGSFRCLLSWAVFCSTTSDGSFNLRAIA